MIIQIYKIFKKIKRLLERIIKFTNTKLCRIKTGNLKKQYSENLKVITINILNLILINELKIQLTLQLIVDEVEQKYKNIQ